MDVVEVPVRVVPKNSLLAGKGSALSRVGRTLLVTLVLSVNSATLPYGQTPLEFGVARTNAELMAAAKTMAATPADSEAVDVPLERFGTSLKKNLKFDSAVTASASGGLRLDFAFVGATGQGVPDTMGAAGPTQ